MLSPERPNILSHMNLSSLLRLKFSMPNLHEDGSDCDIASSKHNKSKPVSSDKEQQRQELQLCLFLNGNPEPPSLPTKFEMQFGPMLQFS